jgi:uncharacterized membrane protein
MTPTVWTAIAAILAFAAAIGWPWIMLEVFVVCSREEPDSEYRRRRLACCAVALVMALGISAVSWHQAISGKVEAARAAPFPQ